MKPCLDCGTPSEGSRCEEHERAVERKRTRPSKRERYGRGWDRIARRVVARQPWCTYCGATEDLTADHVHPASQGGPTTMANLQTLCRSCNSKKGDRLPTVEQLELGGVVPRPATLSGPSLQADFQSLSGGPR